VILLIGTGTPVGEQQNGEHEHISDDETANPHSIPLAER
jgi:hypothetical protein